MRTEDRLLDHLAEARTLYAPEKMVGLFLQGSQNYGLDIHGPGYISDVDSKLVLLPSFEDIVMNKKAVSTTHVRANDEHIDLKDLRLMLQTFRKQNTNFIEILFTKYKSYDFVLTHTCPLSWEPRDLFLKGLDQDRVDKSMEGWLDAVRDSINYRVWLFGHYHADRIERPCVEQFFHDVEDIETIWQRWTSDKELDW